MGKNVIWLPFEPSLSKNFGALKTATVEKGDGAVLSEVAAQGRVSVDFGAGGTTSHLTILDHYDNWQQHINFAADNWEISFNYYIHDTDDFNSRFCFIMQSNLSSDWSSNPGSTSIPIELRGQQRVSAHDGAAGIMIFLNYLTKQSTGNHDGYMEYPLSSSDEYPDKTYFRQYVYAQSASHTSNGWHSLVLKRRRCTIDDIVTMSSSGNPNRGGWVTAAGGTELSDSPTPYLRTDGNDSTVSAKPITDFWYYELIIDGQLECRGYHNYPGIAGLKNLRNIRFSRDNASQYFNGKIDNFKIRKTSATDALKVKKDSIEVSSVKERANQNVSLMIHGDAHLYLSSKTDHKIMMDSAGNWISANEETRTGDQSGGGTYDLHGANQRNLPVKPRDLHGRIPKYGSPTRQVRGIADTIKDSRGLSAIMTRAYDTTSDAFGPSMTLKHWGIDKFGNLPFTISESHPEYFNHWGKFQRLLRERGYMLDYLDMSTGFTYEAWFANELMEFGSGAAQKEAHFHLPMTLNPYSIGYSLGGDADNLTSDSHIISTTSPYLSIIYADQYVHNNTWVATNGTIAGFEFAFPTWRWTGSNYAQNTHYFHWWASDGPTGTQNLRGAPENFSSVDLGQFNNSNGGSHWFHWAVTGELRDDGRYYINLFINGQKQFINYGSYKDHYSVGTTDAQTSVENGEGVVKGTAFANTREIFNSWNTFADVPEVWRDDTGAGAGTFIGGDGDDFDSGSRISKCFLWPRAYTYQPGSGGEIKNAVMDIRFVHKQPVYTTNFKLPTFEHHNTFAEIQSQKRIKNTKSDGQVIWLHKYEDSAGHWDKNRNTGRFGIGEATIKDDSTGGPGARNLKSQYSAERPLRIGKDVTEFVAPLSEGQIEKVGNQVSGGAEMKLFGKFDEDYVVKADSPKTAGVGLFFNENRYYNQSTRALDPQQDRTAGCGVVQDDLTDLFRDSFSMAIWVKLPHNNHAGIMVLNDSPMSTNNPLTMEGVGAHSTGRSPSKYQLYIFNGIVQALYTISDEDDGVGYAINLVSSVNLTSLGGIWDSYSSSSSVPSNWFHICHTLYNSGSAGTGNISKLYINGSLVDGPDTAANFPAFSKFRAGTENNSLTHGDDFSMKMGIGPSTNAGSSPSLKSVFGWNEWVAFSKTLTDDEVKKVYNRTRRDYSDVGSVYGHWSVGNRSFAEFTQGQNFESLKIKTDKIVSPVKIIETS